MRGRAGGPSISQTIIIILHFQLYNDNNYEYLIHSRVRILLYICWRISYRIVVVFCLVLYDLYSEEYAMLDFSKLCNNNNNNIRVMAMYTTRWKCVDRLLQRYGLVFSFFNCISSERQ